jgi:hypothetical protein
MLPSVSEPHPATTFATGPRPPLAVIDEWTRSVLVPFFWSQTSCRPPLERASPIVLVFDRVGGVTLVQVPTPPAEPAPGSRSAAAHTRERGSLVAACIVPLPNNQTS